MAFVGVAIGFGVAFVVGVAIGLWAPWPGCVVAFVVGVAIGFGVAFVVGVAIGHFLPGIKKSDQLGKGIFAFVFVVVVVVVVVVSLCS